MMAEGCNSSDTGASASSQNGTKKRKGRKGKKKWRREREYGFGRWKTEDMWKRMLDPHAYIIHEDNVPPDVTHARVKIPPLCSTYRPEKYIDSVPPEEILTFEEENAIRVKDLKETKIFEVVPLKVPKNVPTKIELVEITNKGTVMIVLKDKRNEVLFKTMTGHMKYFFRWMQVDGCDVRIQAEDVINGRIVVGMIEDGKEWLRAKIVGFNSKMIKLYAIDYAFNFSLPYERVFYIHRKLADYPCRIQECHLYGLEKLENSFFFLFLYGKVKKLMDAKMYPDLDGLRSDDKEEGLDIRGFDFILTKIRKIKKQGDYMVEIRMPDEVAKDVSLSELVRSLMTLDSMDNVVC